MKNRNGENVKKYLLNYVTQPVFSLTENNALVET